MDSKSSIDSANDKPIVEMSVNQSTIEHQMRKTVTFEIDPFFKGMADLKNKENMLRNSTSEPRTLRRQTISAGNLLEIKLEKLSVEEVFSKDHVG